MTSFMPFELKQLRRRVFSPLEWAYTLFLFIKSDIKTTLIPITIFAFATTPLTPLHLSRERILATVIWTTLHLFQCTFANQYLPTAFAEDRLNKPSRPLPSGRISLRTASILRFAAVPLCLGVSIPYGNVVTCASLVLTGFIFLYNELDGGAYWAPRNLLNGLAFAAFETGATTIATISRGTPTQNHGSPVLDDTAISAICISAVVFATTNFAQDFKDVDGDAKVGRTTIPMLLRPTTARSLLLLLLLAWSGWLVQVWALEIYIALAYIGLAVAVGWRFLLKRSARDDQISFYLYNVWLTATHALPAYYRLVSSHT